MKQEIIQKIEQQIEAGIYPGASFAYYQDGVWSDWYLGEANPEIGEQTCQGLVYDLASVSKVVGVGTVLTFLWHQGELDIEKSVTEFLPDSDYPDITIRQLLTHATDLDPYIPNRDQLNAEELKEAMFHLNSTREASISVFRCALSLTRIYPGELFWKRFRPNFTRASFGSMEDERNSVLDL